MLSEQLGHDSTHRDRIKSTENIIEYHDSVPRIHSPSQRLLNS
jgi:hypothetical protein